MSQGFLFYFFLCVVSTYLSWELRLHVKHPCCPEVFSLAGAVFSVPVLWREEVMVLPSKRCGSMPPPPSGQTVFMLLDERKRRERWNFYLLWRFSPRQNSKLNSICLDFKKQKITKVNIQLFKFYFVCFCHWNLSQTCLYEAERRERVRQILTGIACWEETRGCTLLACVCVHECVC